MKKNILAGLVCLGLIVLAQVAGAASAPSFPWGRDVAQFKDLHPYFEKNGVLYYYARGADVSALVGEEDPMVVYGFKGGKLYCVILEIRTAQDFLGLQNRFVEAWGKPRQKADGLWTISQWDAGDEAVRLKSDVKTGRMKVGFYYKPLVR